MLRLFGASYSSLHLITFMRLLHVFFYAIESYILKIHLVLLNDSGATTQTTMVYSPQRNSALTFNTLEKERRVT